MRKSTVVLIFNDNKILLCMKKRGFWAWKWNWPGWKVNPEEEILDAAIRELNEEVGIQIDKNFLKYSWLIQFSFDNKSEWNQEMSIYSVYWYKWNVSESEEMKPEWFSLDNIPYDNMWDADKIWIPRVINKEEIEYQILFDMSWKLISYKKIK